MLTDVWSASVSPAGASFSNAHAVALTPTLRTSTLQTQKIAMSTGEKAPICMNHYFNRSEFPLGTFMEMYACDDCDAYEICVCCVLKCQLSLPLHLHHGSLLNIGLIPVSLLSASQRVASLPSVAVCRQAGEPSPLTTLTRLLQRPFCPAQRRRPTGPVPSFRALALVCSRSHPSCD